MQRGEALQVVYFVREIDQKVVDSANVGVVVTATINWVLDTFGEAITGVYSAQDPGRLNKSIIGD